MNQLTYKDWKAVTDTKLLVQYAITAALSADWGEATKINRKILKVEKDDIEALNRLAKAHIALGNHQKAQKIYKQVLTIDPYNLIARKNSEKIGKSDGKNHHNGSHNGQAPAINLSAIFLFEPGKTKIVNLLNLAPPAILCTLNCADKVTINPKKHAVSIASLEDVYLGALPDDLAHRLISFIAGGNQYEAYVKCVTTKILTIFIREVYRSEKFFNQPSFNDNRSFYFEDTGQPT